MNDTLSSVPSTPDRKPLWIRILVSKAFKIVLMNLVIFALLVGLIEFGLAMLYAHPPNSKPILLAVYEYYRSHEGDIIQYKRECAVFDPEVSYTLKPDSEFIFSNREFSNAYRVNSMGVRDDEASLQAPEIIVMGDSNAMGWGVEQDESFPEVLEKLSGRTVLNTGIASFGTIREARFLRRFDRSGLKYLVIQYCDNDYVENKRFMESGSELHTMKKSTYDITGAILRRRLQPYFFGKYMKHFAPLIVDGMKSEQERIEAEKSEELDRQLRNEARNEVKVFLNALVVAGPDLTNVEIIVLELNRHNENDTYFIDVLSKYLHRPKTNPRYKALHIHPLDVSRLLKNKDYLVHDDHMRASGHRIVAEALHRKIRELEELER